jgi:ArsR family transcriptional regulator
VCELTAALQQSQPKISRHLAQLRSCGLLQDRRRGQWVFYRLHPLLPEWAQQVVGLAREADGKTRQADSQRLRAMSNRPERLVQCV